MDWMEGWTDGQIHRKIKQPVSDACSHRVEAEGQHCAEQRGEVRSSAVGPGEARWGGSGSAVPVSRWCRFPWPAAPWLRFAGWGASFLPLAPPGGVKARPPPRPRTASALRGLSLKASFLARPGSRVGGGWLLSTTDREDFPIARSLRARKRGVFMSLSK